MTKQTRKLAQEVDRLQMQLDYALSRNQELFEDARRDALDEVQKRLERLAVGYSLYASLEPEQSHARIRALRRAIDQIRIVRNGTGRS